MKMKAITYYQYGSPDVLNFEEVAKPIPQANEVLVKIHAASINVADWRVLTGTPFLVRLMTGGVLKPKIKLLGADIAGRVEAVGANVRAFQIGDAVFGDISSSGWGGLAEYAAVPENVLALKPSNSTFAQAAAVPMAAVTALQGLRAAGTIQSGQSVLVQGASGGVGTFVLQLAKAYGANVTAVCSTRNVDMARSIGADAVIDYTREDFTKNGKQYDFIFGVNGHHSLADYARALKPNGVYVCVGGTMAQIFESMLLGPLVSKNGNRKLKNMGVAEPSQNDLRLIKELIEAGKIVPVIDKCYPLQETAQAFRYLGAGHAKGKIVIMNDAGE